ncbi:MAG: hypothetical protein LH606_00040 [Cytophagaceae bacterium]|nr:hypothetical protein [Cytophagaceae bacterium]
MKKILVLLIATLLAAPAFAQKSKAPDAVKTQFAKAYPNAQKVKWEKEDGNYEVSFRFGGDKMSAVFDQNGTQIQSEKEITTSQLPATVQEFMKKEGKKIKEAAEITNASGAKFYEAEAGRKDYYFNAQGQPVEKID